MQNIPRYASKPSR